MVDDHWINPAATVLLLASSIRTKLPVAELSTYRSAKTGCASDKITWPMSFRASVEEAGWRTWVETSHRCLIWSIRERASRIVWSSRYLRFGSSGASPIQQSVALRVRVAVGGA